MASAKEKRRKSARGSRRRQAPRNRWPKPASPLEFGREQFRFTLRRGRRRLPTLNIDPFIERDSSGRIDHADD